MTENTERTKNTVKTNFRSLVESARAFSLTGWLSSWWSSTDIIISCIKSFSSGQIEARIYSASLFHNLFPILLNYIFLIIRRFINVKIVQLLRYFVKHIIQQFYSVSNRLKSKRYQFIDTMLHNTSIILSSNDHQLSIQIRVIASSISDFVWPFTIRHCEVLTATIGDFVEWIIS